MSGTKIRLTESELTYLIKRIVAESKIHDEELDEGMFGPSKEELNARREELENKIHEFQNKYLYFKELRRECNTSWCNIKVQIDKFSCFSWL